MYVQGMLLPVKTDRKDDYQKLAVAMYDVMKDYGAVGCMENWADDVPLGTNTSFPRALQLKDDETAVLSWLVFPDKAARDRCLGEGMQDARMGALFNDMPVDVPRMIWGGFETIFKA